jgi:hypothetical protein
VETEVTVSQTEHVRIASTPFIKLQTNFAKENRKKPEKRAPTIPNVLVKNAFVTMNTMKERVV